MKIFATLKKHLRTGGEPHTGWLPEGFQTPRPTPVRDLEVEFEIRDDGSKHFILSYQSTDKSNFGDTWHQTMDDAIEQAKKDFGIQPSEWIFNKAAKLAEEKC